MFSRLKSFAEKRIRAHKWGINLVLSEGFQLPDKVVLNGKSVHLNLPKEQGVSVAFSEIVFADCYGLSLAKGTINTVLDIGGNVGLFSLAARQAFPNAKIHAYEPNPQQEKYLEVQAKAANFQYFLEAVELEDGHVSLDLHDDSVQTTSQVDDSGKIPAIAFRKAVDRLGGTVDFAKVDCEGAEWRIWKDYDAWQKVRHLSCEYHIQDGHTHEEAASQITSLGFTITYQERADTFGVIRAFRDAKDIVLGDINR
ncbi:MAG: FkbM family methyltransferase [Armatimonadota bacterium]